MTTKPINFDAALIEEFPEAFVPKAEKTKEIELFGEVFDVKLGVNVAGLMNAISGEDVGGMSRLMLKLISEDQRRRFTATLEDAPQLRIDDAEKAAAILYKIMNMVVEVASGGNPTAPSSASPTGTRRKAAVKRSAAS